MNSLTQNKVKTITVYTRQEIISYFKQFKQKINKAYETEDQSSASELLKILNLTLVLENVVGFIEELNTVGDIQVTSYLQALFVKNSMWSHLDTHQNVKNITLQLINLFQNMIKTYKMPVKFSQIQYQKQFLHFSLFFSQSLNQSYIKKDIEFLILFVDWFKVKIITEIHINKLKQFQFSTQNKEAKTLTKQWSEIVKVLVKYCRIVQNLKKEQTAISICYWLCSNEKMFIKQCVNEGIINILKRSLVNKNISESYGIKIINFLKLLILEESGTSQFADSDFQNSIVKFSRKLSNQKSLKQIRQLMNFNEVKNKLNHKQKLQSFKDLSFQPKVNENQLIQNIHLLGLYAQSDKISDFVFNSESDRFSALIQNKALCIQMFKQIFSAASFIFSTQKGNISFIECLLSKLASIIQSKSQSVTIILKSDRKRLLINFIRIMKELLQNKKYFNEIINIFKQINIEKSLTFYSDCTNFVYEKQLLQFKLTINSVKTSKSQKQDSDSLELINALKKHLVLQQNSPLKKLPGQDELAQIKLLYQLIQQNPKQANINHEIIQIIANKMFVEIEANKNDKLSIFQTNDSFKINQIKRQINLYSLKFFQQLLKLNQTKIMMQNEDILMKIIKIALNTQDLNILDNVIIFVIHYFNNFTTSTSAKKSIQELWKKALELSKLSNTTEFLQVLKKISNKSQSKNDSQQKIIKNYLEQSTKKEKIPLEIENQFLKLIKTMQSAKVQQSLKLLSQIQPLKQNILQYLKIIYESSKNYSLKQMIFKLFSVKLKTLYAKQIQSPSGQAEMIKNKIYQELVSVNINKNEKYFEDFLKITLMRQYNPQITKQQLIWIEEILSQLKESFSSYTFSAERQKNLFRFIENCPQMIGIQCALNIQYDKQEEEQFFKINAKKLINGIQDQNFSIYNVNFFLFYSLHCQNQIFQSYGFINVIDKDFLVLKKQLKYLFIAQQGINFPNLVEKIKTTQLDLIQKRAKIICNFICNQNLILNENQCQHCVREICQILTFLKQSVNILQKILQPKDKQVLVKIFQNLLKSFIHIGKNQLRSKQLSQQHQKLCCEFIKQFTSLKSKDINELLSELMRLIMLKDKERKYYKIQKQQAFDKSFNDLNKLNTERGLDHLNVCKQIISKGQAINKKEMNKLISDYFLIQMQEQTISQPVNDENIKRQSINRVSRKSLLSQNGQIADSQLLRHLKALLNPPYTYGINIISKFLRPIQSKQYVDVVLDVFVMSSQLYEEDLQNKNLSLSQLRKLLIDSVLEEYCELNERFYSALSMSKEGATLALKRKNIGKKGIQIICQKMVESKETDEFIIYAEILTVNALTLDQLTIINNYKLPSIVGNVYCKKSLRPNYCEKLGNFIGHTSKLQQNQQQYTVNQELIQNLTAYKNNTICISATLNAIAGLVYCNVKNQKQFGNKQNLQKIVNYCANENSTESVIQKGFNALANIAYKNKPIWRIYFDLEIDRKSIKILSYFSTRDSQSSACIKQILRLLGIIALTSEGGFKLTTMRYLSFAQQLFNTYLTKKQFPIINQIISVIFNISNQVQNDNRVTIKKLDEQKVVDFILKVAKQCALNGPIVECCLQTLQNLLNYEFILQKSVTEQLLQLMENISQTQQTNQSVFVKWFRLMYLIYKNEKKIVQISLSNILYSASNYMRAIDVIEDKILEINMSLILKIKDSLSVKEIINCGWIQFLIENLKAKNHTSANLTKILDILIELTQNNLLNPFVCTKLFEILIKRLQLQYRDQNARKLILLLKRIKQKITISTQTSIFLLQFSCFFLTQKQIILSPRYHRRVRQIISVLAYFISFNIELKIVFRDPNLASILRDWIKVDTLIQDESSISESCRFLLFTIYNDQSTLMTLREDGVFGEHKARDELEKGLKCTLYRRDGSNKSAMIKLNKETNQIMAYKLPNGEIKTKYTIPLKTILVMRTQYEQDEDILYNDSVFSKDDGIFSKKHKSELLMTIFGMVGEDLSIREINVEFSKQHKKTTFANYLRLIITADTQKRLKV